MKVNLACKNILISAILATGIVTSGAASAGLMNQNFSSGFSNWEGDITSSDDTSNATEFPFTGVFGDFGDNFQTITNGVKLTTSEEDDFTDYYEVIIFQEFDIESLTAGNTTLSLFLDFTTIFTAPNPQDTSEYLPDAWAYITDGAGTVEVDLTGGGTFDITSLAGQNNAYIEFGVIDDGDDIGNPTSLSVSNIMFTQSGSMPPTSVPEPSTLLLFTGALFAVMRKSKLITK